MRVPVVVLALLLAVAPVAAATGTFAPATTPPDQASVSPVVGDRNTSEYLAIPDGEIETQRVESVTLDVGGAMAADNGEIHGRFGTVSIIEAYRSAGTEQERYEAVRRGADRTERRIEQLREREQTVRQRFIDGELSAERYLRQLAVIDAKARKLDQTVERLEAYDNVLDAEPLGPERLATMREGLMVLHGPTRALVRDAMAGEVEHIQVYLAAGDESLALATVNPSNDRYAREAYVLDAREPGSEDKYDQRYSDELLSRLEELYPWTFDNRDGSLSFGGHSLIQVNVYRAVINHRHGQMITYFDGGSDQVFYEVQEKTLSRVPTHETRSNTADGLVVQVNRTRVGGPLEIRVRNELTGLPVDATVTVNNRTVGDTGDDGRVWTVTPGGQLTVEATRGSSNATVIVPPEP